MATPAGSGGVEQTLVTSTLWFTVKSVALLTVVPSGLSTSSAYRRAEGSKEGGTKGGHFRCPAPLANFGNGTPPRRTLCGRKPVPSPNWVAGRDLPTTV